MVKSLAILLLVGVSAQFLVGCLLGFVEMLFPEAMAEYAELMEDTSVGVFAIVSALSIAVLAPINEEIVCRGVMLECAMRAMSPGWNATDGARYRAVSARAFWIANTLQALAFGVLHMNLIQGSYAFVLGAVLGWVFWRTGKLRYPIILHFAMNASSYLVEPLYPLLSVVPTGLVIVFAAVMFALGIRGSAGSGVRPMRWMSLRGHRMWRRYRAFCPWRARSGTARLRPTDILVSAPVSPRR